jgi:hypothetical protein
MYRELLRARNIGVLSPTRIIIRNSKGEVVVNKEFKDF